MEFLITLGLAFIVFLGFLTYFYRVHLYCWLVEFPKPIYPMTVSKNVMISMKDGVKLATDIYHPKAKGKFPVIILRTPYNKNGSMHPYKLMALLFVSQGYVFMVQDVRGRYNSEGEYHPYQNEGQDGYETIEWAGQNIWSSGKVALYGFSYLGSCAWLSVPFKSPYLKTIVPMFTTQDIYSVFMDKGSFHLKGTLYWLTKYIGKGENNRLPFRKLKKSFMKLPVSSLDQDAIGYTIKAYQDYISHIVPDDFWTKICVSQRMGEINIPALIVTGWFDTYVDCSINDFIRMNASGPHSKNKQSRLVIGPWTHNPSQKFPGEDYGRKANFNLQLVNTLKWCDYWLKEPTSYFDPQKRINYFVMGKNEWRSSDHWPPEEAKHINLYCSAKHTGIRCVHSLSENIPEDSSNIEYKYDPANPVPFRGSHHLHDSSWVGPFEQTELLCRKDIITFMTEPLKEDLLVAGVIKLVLFVSTDCLDTDFCAKICDVQPGGASHYLQAGFMRMRYRESLHMPSLVEPHKVYRLEIVLGSTAHLFMKDHRIEIQISSSDFPVHDRNLNTGQSAEFSTAMKVANQTIYCGGDHLSYLVIPLIPLKT